MSSKSVTKNDASITSRASSSTSVVNDELPIQVVRSGSDATNSNVIWKAFSMASAYLRAQENLMKSAYSVFSIAPNSGVIPPSQKQSIKIEFCPRESTDLYLEFLFLNFLYFATKITWFNKIQIKNSKDFV